MSTISSSTTSTTAYKVTADTTGTLVIQTGATPTTAVTVGTDQSFNFSATGQRITGDFSNATLANRVAFQSSTTNGATVVTAIPNGSSAQSFFTVHNSSDITNSSLGYIAATALDIRILSTSTGTGTNLPLTFFTGGSERMRVDTSGNVGIGTSSPSAKFVVAGGGAAIQGNGFPSTGSGWELYTDNSTGTGLNGSWLQSYSRTSSAWMQANYNALAHIFSTSGAERMRIDSSGNLQFNSGYGSVATAYGCRAWVNFNGTGVVAIRASGNVTSITDNGVGDYRINFTNSMPDANYSWGFSTNNERQISVVDIPTAADYSTYQLAGSLRIQTAGVTSGSVRALDDHIYVAVQIFR